MRCACTSRSAPRSPSSCRPSIRSFLAHRKRGAVDMDLLRAGSIAGAGRRRRSRRSSPRRSQARAARHLRGHRLRRRGCACCFNRESWRLGDDLPANPVAALVGAVIGFLSTLMGIGGGVLNNTFMTLYGRPMHQAVATSAGVGVLISIPGVVGYIWAGWGDAAAAAVLGRLRQSPRRAAGDPDHRARGAVRRAHRPRADRAASSKSASACSCSSSRSASP